MAATIGPYLAGVLIPESTDPTGTFVSIDLFAYQKIFIDIANRIHSAFLYASYARSLFALTI